jgi:8-oxo-dGTP pyrophosphatase MutT (NUDIX family)
LAENLVAPAHQVELVVVTGEWQHARDHVADIAAFWDQQQAANPMLFNGSFYILDAWQLADGIMRGTCHETNYAAYLHWRAQGFVSPGYNAFAMPVVRSMDGGVLLGRMAPWTVNAGSWYMPAGSIDNIDVLDDGRIDLAGNMSRELLEEIGLKVLRRMVAPTWTLVFTRGRLAMFREIVLRRTADALIIAVEQHLAHQERSELDAVCVVYRRSDCHGFDMPPFLMPYLETILPP